MKRFYLYMTTGLFIAVSSLIAGEGSGPPALPVNGFSPRYLEVTPLAGIDHIALQITIPASGQSPAFNKYVQANGSLGDLPVYRMPEEWATSYPHGAEILPNRNYELSALTKEGAISAPTNATTRIWGDVTGSASVVDLDDLLFVLNRFTNSCSGCPDTLRADLVGWMMMMQPNPTPPDGRITVDDILAVLGAFIGYNPYP